MIDEGFLNAVTELFPNFRDRALCLLWWEGRQDPARGMTVREICDALESRGYPRQNTSRLNTQLTSDRRVSRASGARWRLHPRTRSQLDSRLGHLRAPAVPKLTGDLLIPSELVAGTRGYLERVVAQANSSYEFQLYDCCAVMCRRALETLIIEAYEAEGRAAAIKGSDGHFLMFSGLLGAFEGDPVFHASRHPLRGLRDFKNLGDLSAHSRRFNARKDDIDRVRDGLRVAVEELVHIAKLG